MVSPLIEEACILPHKADSCSLMYFVALGKVHRQVASPEGVTAEHQTPAEAPALEVVERRRA